MDLDEFALLTRHDRASVPLLPGETEPYVGPYEMPPPEGRRWETDAELRERLKNKMRNAASPVRD